MLINLRNALMTGKRLPYDAEVEYIRGTGTQYINTGLYQNPNTEYKVTVMPEASTNLTVGNFNGGGAYGFRLSFHAGGVFQDWYSSRISISAQSFNQIYTATVKRGSLRVQGSSIDQTATGTQSDTTSSAPIYLLSAPNPPGAIGAVKLYSFQVWQNGVLVFDGIPVRKGTVGYLYDRVSGKLFGNAGTGDFVLGPDVVPVEYIESTGTQYINTGIRVDDTCGYNISFMGLDGNDRIIMGVKGAGDSRWALSGSLAPAVNLSWNANSGYSGLGLGKIQEARMNYLNDRRRILNGVNVGNITSPLSAFANSYDVCLFAAYWGNANVSLYSAARIYFAQISKGQEIVRSFRPVCVGTEGAMMDVLTRRIYRNAGTGAFGYGNDLKYPIPAS